MAAVAGKTESRTARFRQWPASRDKAKTRAPKATRAFGWRGRKTTCGLRQRRPSSKPFAASAIAPGPFRGWGRKSLARIRAQREPVVPPAGTGTQYPRPKGPPHGSSGGKASGSPSWPRQGTPIKGMAAGAIRGAMTFSPRRPMTGRRGAHTVAEGDARFGSPARCGTFASPLVKRPARQGEVRVRTPWRQRAACAVRCAGPSGTRSATCPCSPGIASMTRTRRSCPCAAASVRRTAGRPAPAAA